jgi:hypothetical protein
VLDVNKAEAQIDALIERRAHEAKVANEETAAWRASELAYNHVRAAERRRAWPDYHRHRIVQFEDLAAEHREKLGQLIDGGAGGKRG